MSSAIPTSAPGHWSPVTPLLSPVDHPSDLPLAQPRRRKPTLPYFGRYTGEDVWVLQLLAAQLDVAPRNEEVEGLGEVFQYLGHHALSLGPGQTGRPLQMRQQVRKRGRHIHRRNRTTQHVENQDICPISGKN